MLSIKDAIVGRQSIRAYLPKPVPRETIREILKISSRAPSGSNTQPWKVYVLDGAPLKQVSHEMHDAFNRGEKHEGEYRYYPKEWRDPYLARRRANGWGLYGLLDITRDDKDKMKKQIGRNYLFFDAPVGFIFTIDRDLEVGAWFDYGMFMQNIMLAARSFGLETCPQQAFAQYHRILQKRLAIPAEEMVLCGMALGYADPDEKVNTFRTEREEVDQFTRFVDELSE